MSMKRNDWLWLVIRILGLFFMAKALVAIPVIPVNIILLRSISLTTVTNSDMNLTVGQNAAQYVTVTLVKAILEFLFYGLVGLYLCRKGTYLHRFIRYPKNLDAEDSEKIE